MINTITIESLLQADSWNDGIDCTVTAINPKKDIAQGIGNSCFPDYTIDCQIPSHLRWKMGDKTVRLQIHAIWLMEKVYSRFTGLVIDKTDRNLYIAQIYFGDSDSYGNCNFEAITPGEIVDFCRCNPFLVDVANKAVFEPEQLLEYQLYSLFSDRFHYIEVPYEDHVVLCGIGLHTNKLLAVGWVGKLVNKDFFISYAECTVEAYERLKEQYPSLYDRASTMEKNKDQFLCYHTVLDKRRKQPTLCNVYQSFQEEPKSQRNVLAFFSAAHGCIMREYDGPAYRWMEEFVAGCKAQFRGGISL